MKLVERIVIKKNDGRIPALIDVCKKANNLYNVVLYRLRQAYFNKEKFITYNQMDKILRNENQVDYKALLSHTSQQVIKEVYKNWNVSWLQIKQYIKNSESFSGKPDLPRYLNSGGLHIAPFTNQQVKLKKNGIIKFPDKVNIKSIKSTVNNLCQLWIQPGSNRFTINIIYNKDINNLKLDQERFISLDMGVSNIATQINNAGLKPFIISGSQIKSFNQWFNKRKAKLQSKLPKGQFTSKQIKELYNHRYWWMQDKMHKISRIIINYCIKNNIGTIVVGKNKEWKTGINLGSVNNQNFVFMPIAMLLQKIKYKCEIIGVTYIEQEESYTSKCDALALEPIQKHDEYLGKRKKRGLFQSSTGKLINADVNGAINIARKVFGDPLVTEVLNSCAGQAPYRINL